MLATASCSGFGLKGLPDAEMTHLLLLCSQTQDHIDLVWLELRGQRTALICRGTFLFRLVPQLFITKEIH